MNSIINEPAIADVHKYTVAVLRYNVKLLRTARGLTQDALAERAGLTRSTLIAVECAPKNNSSGDNPEIYTISAIAAALNVQVADLFKSVVFHFVEKSSV